MTREELLTEGLFRALPENEIAALLEAVADGTITGGPALLRDAARRLRLASAAVRVDSASVVERRRART